MGTMQGLSARMDDNLALFSDDHDELATVLFGESIQLAFDENGRISLPQQFLDFAGIEGEIAFVGLGNKFQIWNPKTLEERKAAARDAVKSKGMTLPKGDKS